MKTIAIILLLLTVFLLSCKKSNNDSWTAEEKASYQAVLDLQEEAAVNYEVWVQTMDSMQALTQLQQFFQDDASVISATLGAQGIAVEYTNGMGGGFFINPKDRPEYDSTGSFPAKSSELLKRTPLVNHNDMILIDAHYWDRFERTNDMVEKYTEWLPKIGYSLSKTYFDQYADLDCFTRLSGYGIVQIYSHGWAWPDESNIKDVYIMTGEEANDQTSEKYHEELTNKEILVDATKTETGVKNIYWISEKFLANHNDFGKDTVLFVGAFCYSHLGKMPELQNSFAAGTYVGFDWSVTAWNCCNWSIGLITTMCQPGNGFPISSQKWYDYNNTSYYDKEEKRNVSILLSGDTTYLWKTPPPGAETLEATELTGDAALLNANIKPEYFDTRVAFKYGLTADYGKTTDAEIVWKSSQWTPFSQKITGLTPHTTYHYRVIAKNDMGTTVGEDMTFDTPALGMPTAITLDATNLTTTSATLNGTIDPHGITAYGEFEFGETTAYGSFGLVYENPLTGDEPVSVSYNLTNLVSGKTYHYRVNAYHQGHVDIVHGEDKTFMAVEGGFEVGQLYGGGIIFAVEPSGLHGLIAATSDIGPQTGTEWGCYHTEIAGADGLEYGTGSQNTADIMQGCPTQGIAARLCDNQTLQGYDDWYLPSINELYSLYLARDIVGGFNLNGGWYWSSSEFSADQAWMIPFESGTLDKLYKDQKILVRPIRSF
jgi:hypothetical protein